MWPTMAGCVAKRGARARNRIVNLLTGLLSFFSFLFFFNLRLIYFHYNAVRNSTSSCTTAQPILVNDAATKQLGVALIVKDGRGLCSLPRVHSLMELRTFEIVSIVGGTSLFFIGYGEMSDA